MWWDPFVNRAISFVKNAGFPSGRRRIFGAAECRCLRCRDSSNYNTRALAAEVLVHGNKAALIRERQTLPKIWELERLAKFA